VTRRQAGASLRGYSGLPSLSLVVIGTGGNQKRRCWPQSGKFTGVLFHDAQRSGSFRERAVKRLGRARALLKFGHTTAVHEVVYSNAAGEFSLDNLPGMEHTDISVIMPRLRQAGSSGCAVEKRKSQAHGS